MRIEKTFDGIVPQVLREMPNWVAWRLEPRDGRLTKIPLNLKSFNRVTEPRRASSTDPSTWTTYADAVAMRELYGDQMAGLGFVITSPVVFADADGCVMDDGSLTTLGEDFLECFMKDGQTYVELSQSGRGLHALCTGTFPAAKGFNNRTAGTEMYPAGRFCATTFRSLTETADVVPAQGAIDYWYAKYATRSKAADDFRSTARPALTRDDDWVLRQAQSQHGRFNDLWRGDWSAYGSHSNADCALCTDLCYWTNKDLAAVDRLFRRSGLMRSKWMRDSYRLPTLEAASAACAKTFSDWQRERDEAEKEKTQWRMDEPI